MNSVKTISLDHGFTRLDIKRAEPFELINTKIVRTGIEFIDKRLFVGKKPSLLDY